jgi:hypothetical protein
MALLDPGCVKTRTGRISTNYLYKFKPICRGIDGVDGLARPKVAQTSDTSAFLHNQDPKQTNGGAVEPHRLPDSVHVLF